LDMPWVLSQVSQPSQLSQLSQVSQGCRHTLLSQLGQCRGCPKCPKPFAQAFSPINSMIYHSRPAVPSLSRLGHFHCPLKAAS